MPQNYFSFYIPSFGPLETFFKKERKKMVGVNHIFFDQLEEKCLEPLNSEVNIINIIESWNKKNIMTLCLS